MDNVVIERPLFISTALANGRERRTALMAILLSFAVFIAMVPFARVQLALMPAFIPVYESWLVVGDLITAILLFAQYHMLRARSILVLGCGYLFTAAMIVPHALTFPGLFAPTGLLGAGPQTTAWLFMFWHGGFPLLVIGYTLLKGADGETAAPRGSGRAAIVAAVAAVIAAAVALTLVATAGQHILPSVMTNNHYTSAMIVVVGTVWLLSAAALVLLWMRRPYSVLDLWLMVVMAAWLCDVGLSAVFNAGRFDLGFYAGRIYGLLAVTFVLLVLLFDTTSLYAQVVRLLGAEQQERQRADQRHRRMFETSLDLILVTDRRGKFVEVSPSSMAILGYRPDEMTGRTGTQFIHPDDLDSTRNEMRHARRGGTTRNFDCRYVHKNGRAVALNWSGVWLKDEDTHFFIGRDVTEAKRSERLKNEFIATVSHELRTPLTAIAGSLGLLAGRSTERVANPSRLLALAQANSQRLLRLVNDILDIEKIEGDRMVLEFTCVAVPPLVEEAIEANRVLAEKFGVTVRLDRQAVDATIVTDSNRLMQVVINLLSNAVKFSPRGGDVVVTIEAADDRLGIAVRDHGPGIPDEFKTRIFEKFVQVDASDARRRGGTGLGLSIVKQLTIRLGGEVSHEAAPDGGTIFRVDLPRDGARTAGAGIENGRAATAASA